MKSDENPNVPSAPWATLRTVIEPSSAVLVKVHNQCSPSATVRVDGSSDSPAGVSMLSQAADVWVKFGVVASPTA